MPQTLGPLCDALAAKALSSGPVRLPPSEKVESEEVAIGGWGLLGFYRVFCSMDFTRVFIGCSMGFVVFFGGVLWVCWDFIGCSVLWVLHGFYRVFYRFYGFSWGFLWVLLGFMGGF